MQFADIPTTAGSFFKPTEHHGAAAILVEVKRFEAQRPGNYGPKDTVHADLHIFKTDADIDAGRAELSQGALIQSTILARDLSGLVGSATIVKLDQIDLKNSPNKGWVWRQVDAATKAKVVDYAMKRTAAVEAAMDEAPDFD